MFAIYPISLLTLEYLAGRTFADSWSMLFISLSGIFAVLLSPKRTPLFKCGNITIKIRSMTIPRENIGLIIIFCFVFFSITFHVFGWHSDRVSMGASFSAICRALWLLISISVISSNERVKLLYLLLTLILAFIDESRTYFAIAFMIVGSVSRYSKSLFLIGFCLLMALAASRMSQSGNFVSAILYGISGETINATHSFRQLTLVNITHDDSIEHFFNIFFSSILAALAIISDWIFDTGNLSLKIPSELVGAQLNDQLNPMGGWYVANDMIIFGSGSYLVCFLFVYVNYNLTRLLFNDSFPLGTYLFILFPKTNVILFWNMLFYLIVIHYVFKSLTKQKRR